MGKLYFKLAKTNLSNNKPFYIPYIISSIITVAMLYMMSFLSDNKGLNIAMSSTFLYTQCFLCSEIILTKKRNVRYRNSLHFSFISYIFVRYGIFSVSSLPYQQHFNQLFFHLQSLSLCYIVLQLSYHV